MKQDNLISYKQRGTVAKKKEKSKLSNCSSDEVERLLRKLGGFTTRNSKHNIWVRHILTRKMSGFPRRPKSKPINRNLLKKFIDDYLVKQLNYLKDDINKHLKC